jgi:Spy/CpxP family protein refolding chaperone
MNRFLKIASSVSVLSIALAVAGTAFADAAAVPGAPAAAAHEGHGHRRGHHGGDLVHASLSLSTLRADQRAQIQQLVEQQKAAHAGVRAARSDLMEAVARGVESGRVDDASLKPKVDAVARATAANEPAKRAALEKLHTILDASQRAELVNAIEAKRSAHGKAAAPQGNGAKPAHHEGGRGLGHWAKALNLTPQQAQQIQANLRAEHEKDRAAGGAQAAHGAKGGQARLLEAFKADRFVMNEVAPPADPAKATRGAGRIVNMAQAAVPVLTAEQRTAAAAKLRAEAQKGAARAK